ncbi:TIGR01548 family HAD-type hydrolase [Altericista sp. CCNU0014]|uniref:TIGR01548 family HAD-type hydrolase n=1 Tax=Altericista sp. CCNU0014 TaxID=3082949 RepID=UPI00384D633F
MNPPAPTAIAVFDIDGVVRDVAGSYRRAIADTVQHFTRDRYRPTPEDIDALKAEGRWNNDWEASQELIARFFQARDFSETLPDFQAIVDFFQAKYRGENFSGYIQSEPLLMDRSYLEELTQGGVLWGFFSGATRGSAGYVLERRLGLEQPILVAMEDAPGKPDPAGLFQTIALLARRHSFAADLSVPFDFPIIYVGDTVADMQTVERAKQAYPMQQWFAVGVIPPHVQRRSLYAQILNEAGAIAVLDSVGQLLDWIQGDRSNY